MDGVFEKKSSQITDNLINTEILLQQNILLLKLSSKKILNNNILATDGYIYIHTHTHIYINSRENITFIK